MFRLIWIMTVAMMLSLLSLPRLSAEIALPDMGDSAGALVSPIEEFRVGQAFYWQLQQVADLVEDAEINAYLRTLGYRLVGHSDAPHSPFEFFMLPVASINAFAAPGGFIGVHSGLMLNSEREDELASVLAHEIAHVTQRHILRSFERAKQLSMPMTVAMLAAALLGAYDPQVGSAAIMAVQAGTVQMQLNYTRAHEAEADNLGMQMLVRSGFDPHAMPAFFEKLQQAGRFYGGDTVPEFLRTHPITVSRIAESRGRAANLTARPRTGDALQFYLMREKLRVLTTNNLPELSQQYAHMMRDPSLALSHNRFGYAHALLRAGDVTGAREMAQPLLREDPDRLAYQLLLAQIELAAGRFDAALEIYADNQRLYPDDPALTTQQAQALLRVNRASEAIRILQRQFDVGAQDRVMLRLMAQAHEATGQRSESHVWMAEFYYASGRLEQAADQLRIAAEFARQDEFQLARISSRLRQIESAIALMKEG